MKRTILMLSALALAACDDADGGGGAADAAPAAGTLKARAVQTLPFATDDGSEVIKMLPSGDRAVLIASRTGRMTLLAVEEDKLQELKTIELYRDGEVGELTHIAISDDGAFAAITRAIPVEQDGELVGCEGELLLVNVAQNFGQVSKRLAVGPMPDGVDITSDGRWIVTADEADHFRRCPLPDVHGSVTLIELPGGIPSQAVVRARITMDMVGEAHREPETIAFAPDDDRVAVTLQDTHELLFFRRTALLAAGDDPREITVRPVTDFTLTRYPDRADGKPPWPDGLAGFTDDAGAAWFVATGEFNDTFAIFDADGGFLSQTAIDAAALPADLPRDPEDTLGGVIRPDSVATLRYAGHRIFALSLKHAGAVGLWIADDLMAPTFLDLVRVGQSETGSPTTASSVSPEGIAAADRGLVVTANEGESSASLLRLVLEP